MGGCIQMRRSTVRSTGIDGRKSTGGGHPGPRLAGAACLLAALVVASCSLLFPPRLERTLLLLPMAVGDRGDYSLSDAVVSYETQGLRIEVEQMTDRALNEQFPEESAHGRYSTNPYTYGDLVDPAVGYVRSRFTVFRVTVHNLGLARVELRPQRCLVTTNRSGERLEPYGIEAGAGTRSLESYYRSRQGTSGNEHYRFGQRLAIVRTTAFLSDEPIQRGESYGGYIVFDPLEDGVEEVTLHIRDLAVRYNAFGKPLQTMDAAFRFRTEISVQAYREQDARVRGPAATRAALRGPCQVTGHLAGDMARDPATIDAYVRTRHDELNACFEPEFVAGTAVPGDLTVAFTILTHGGIEEARVVSSSLGSESVKTCVVARARQWRLRPDVGVETQVSAQDSVATPSPARVLSAPPTRVFVTSTIEFSEAGVE